LQGLSSVSEKVTLDTSGAICCAMLHGRVSAHVAGLSRKVRGRSGGKICGGRRGSVARSVAGGSLGHGAGLGSPPGMRSDGDLFAAPARKAEPESRPAAGVEARELSHALEFAAQAAAAMVCPGRERLQAAETGKRGRGGTGQGASRGRLTTGRQMGRRHSAEDAPTTGDRRRGRGYSQAGGAFSARRSFDFLGKDTMSYFSIADQQRQKWMTLKEGISHIGRIEKCDEKVALQQLRIALADGVVESSWAVSDAFLDSPEPTLVSCPIADTRERRKLWLSVPIDLYHFHISMTWRGMRLWI